jgi:DNA-directed RNA polymerase II subunit RPB2
VSRSRASFAYHTLSDAAPADPYAYDDPQYGIEDDDDDDGEVTQEHCWDVITSFFDTFGLVNQQISSFNQFIQNTMQELVDESAELILDQAEQHTGSHADSSRRYEIAFGQIYLARPSIIEADGSVIPIFPQEARLRNLTYSAGLYIEMTKRTYAGREDPNHPGETAWDLQSEEVLNGTNRPMIGKARRRLAARARRRSRAADADHASVRVLRAEQGRRGRHV